jgi:type I restriction enzyme M protein
LCKVYDEKNTKQNEELRFQWLEGKDDDVSFQIRLTNLYKDGMRDFLEKEVTDFSETDFDTEYNYLDEKTKQSLLSKINKLRLEKNNEFAIKEVYDEKSFKENAKIVKEVVELLQNFRLRYNKRQQYLSDFFELLLTTGLKQESGQFFTPVPIAQFIIKSLPIDFLVDKKLEKGETNNLLPFLIDYAAGSGHFLTESMHEIQRLIDKKNAERYIDSTARKIKGWQTDHFDWATQYIYGIEKDYRLVKVGKVGCYLHGDGLANVILSDGLANFENTKEYKELLKRTDKDPKENRQFDILVSNPPYSVSAFKNAAREYYTGKDFELYNSLTDNSSEIECLFVERMKQLLKDGGVAGVILPSSILSNEGIYTKAREIILQYFKIVAITELGSNTFMATGTNTVVLFLRRRNNYDSINLWKSVERFLSDYQDVTSNGIEKPVAKYVNHVWEGVGFDDYVTLLKKEPNNTVVSHEIYKEYRKKIKAKTEKDFWNSLIETEKEKLFYFILAYPQKVVLVKTGEKDAEKRFLGYEFSNRRGSEGIHPMQRSKTIDECTRLFDSERFDNPEKASTYIYKAFAGDYDFPIHENLKDNISHVYLVDMMTFDRDSFAKNISTAVKKKAKIESRWEIVRLGEICNLYQPKTITSQEIKDSGKYKVFGANGVIGFYDEYNHEDAEIAITCRGATCGTVNYTEPKSWITGNAMVAKPVDKNISKRFLFHLLSNSDLSETITGTAQPQITRTTLASYQIPLPPLEIQQKIVSEIEVLERKEQEAKGKIAKLQNSISTIIEKTNGITTKLQDITTKIGSGATPLGGEGVYKNIGITFIRSQNIYDGYFLEEGLAYIDEEQAKKLDNVTIEKNDILFNITGASIARCCVVDEKYLPARVNQHVSIIRTNEKVLSKYVQLILVSKEYKDKLLQIGEGATSRQAITKSQLENFSIPLPPLLEQQKIVAEIEKIEALIAEARKVIDEIPALKNEILKIYL